MLTFDNADADEDGDSEAPSPAANEELIGAKGEPERNPSSPAAGFANFQPVGGLSRLQP